MGIFSVNRSTDTKKLEALLVEGERIETIYKLRVDQICFTNKRVIFFDNKMFSKKKVRVFLPYKTIESFAIQEAGMFDPDTGLVLMTRGKTFELEFAKETDLTEVQAILTKYLCS
ncbi:PH domain-containing protein [Bacillus velezensis]|uniref:PH domain-containing protein n=1 Tax=Bacillus velezensis TaxID=492670 RepID=UPI002DBE6507|nr:PH domain-containing protein [Bacillus velezensis]MEC0384304.1 PH domain-containing protein [Bacillus velezensis]